MSSYSSTSSDSPSAVIIIIPILGVLFFFAFIGCAISAARTRSRRYQYPNAAYQPSQYVPIQEPQREIQSGWQGSASNTNRWSTVSGPNVGGNTVSTTRSIDSSLVDPNRPLPSPPSQAHVAGSTNLERRTASPEPRAPRRRESIASTRVPDEELPAYTK